MTTSHASELVEPTEREHLLFMLHQVNRERARLLAATMLAGVGHWEWRPDSDEVIGSDQLCRLHGAAHGELDGGLRALLAAVHPDDRDQVERGLRAAAADGRPFTFRYRVVWPDGQVCTLQTRGEVGLDNLEGSRRLFAVSSDVSDDERDARRSVQATILAQAGRCTSLDELEPALESVARAALPHLGQSCSIDLVDGVRAIRLLELRVASDVHLEPPELLASLCEPEVHGGVGRSRLTVPVRMGARHLGVLSFVRTASALGGESVHHRPDELALARELADRVAMLIGGAEERRQLHDALADREQLLYVVGHELRSPLTSLRLSIDGLMKAGSAAGAAVRQLEIVDRIERRLTALVNELLDVGRIRSGQLAMELAPVDLGELVGEVAARMALDIARSGSEVVVRAAPAVVGRWDRSRIDQVVTNLLTNALKFGEGRPVEIRVAAGAGAAVLTVTDQGMGIERSLQPSIFDLFKRAPEARRMGGLGLGLHIVRAIVGGLGGDIRVDSEPGHGATFTVELPLGHAGA